MALGFVGMVLTARYLGPDQFGYLSSGGALAAMFSPISTFGVMPLMVRDLTKNDWADTSVVWGAIGLRAIGAVASLGCCGLALVLFSDRLGASSAVALILTFAYLPMAFDAMESWFLVRGSLITPVLIRCGVATVGLAARVFLVWEGAGLEAFAMVTLAECIVVAIMLFSVGRVCLGPGRPHQSQRYMRSVVPECGPMIVASLAAAAYMRVDQLLLLNLATPDQVGIYAAAVRLAEFYYFVPIALLGAWSPLLTSSLSNGSTSTFHSTLLPLMRRLVGLSVLMSALLTVFAPLIMTAAFSEAYSDSSMVLRAHCWSSIFVTLGLAAGVYYVNLGIVRFQMLAAIVGLVASVALNIVLIPILGALGASFSAVLAYAVSAVGMNWVFSVTRPLGLLQVRALAFWLR